MAYSRLLYTLNNKIPSRLFYPAALGLKIITLASLLVLPKLATAQQQERRVQEQQSQASTSADSALSSQGTQALENSLNNFDIPAQPLGDALLKFAEQADITVIAPGKILEDLRSSTVKGRMPATAALQALLAQTDLRYEVTENNNLRLHAPASTNAVRTRPRDDANKQDDSRLIEELLVTIGRRQESMQRFVGTVQAFDKESLKRLGINHDFQGIQTAIPGLQISLNEGFQEVFVRGIGTQDNSVSSDQPTAVHYNNAHVPQLRGLGPVMFDIEQVEVNHGPQGTLRGRNATAGTINILPKLPQMGSTGSEFLLETSSFSGRQVGLVGNVAVEESLAARVAYHFREHDNYYTNAANPGDSIQEVSGTGSEEEEAWRISLLWEPRENTSVNVVYDLSNTGGNGFPGNYAGQSFSQGIEINDLDNPWQQFFQTEGMVDNEVQSVVLTTLSEYDNLGVEFIASMREYEGLTVNPRRPFQHGFRNEIVQSIDDISVWQFDNFNTNWISDASDSSSAELRFFSPKEDESYYWTAGMFLSKEDATEFRWDVADVSALSQTNLGGPDLTKATSKSASAYFDGTIRLGENARLIGGLRYTYEKKTSARWDAAISFGPYLDTLDLNDNGDRSEIISPTNPLGQLVRLGTPGFSIVPAKDQPLLNPLTDFATPEDFLLSMISSYGERDNLRQVIAANPGSGTIQLAAPGGIANDDFKDNYFNWRLGYEYMLKSDHMVYGTLSTGSRAGGINDPIFLAGEAVQSTYDKEQIKALEVGSKNQFIWRSTPMIVNISAFYYEYKNQVFQIAQQGDGDTFGPGSSNVAANLRLVNVNVGKSEIYGLTLESDMILNYGFWLGWNMLYIDGKIKEGATSDGRQQPMLRDTNGDGERELVLPPVVDISGNPLINSSKFSVTVTLGQDFELPWGPGDWTLTGSYKSSFHSSPFNNRGYDFDGNEIALREMRLCCGLEFVDANGDGQNEIGDGRFFNDEVDSTLIWNLNIGTNFGQKDRYRFEVFGNNLTKEAYPQKQIINPFVNIAFLNTPRVFGLRFETAY